MKIYNTASRQIEEFRPLEDNQVKLYTCGPTVYDFAQIGNLRAFVFDDTLRRVLEACGYKVRHVMNITDVGHLVSDEDEGDDKLEKGAARENRTVWQVADHYIDSFIKDARALNLLEPNAYSGPHGVYARATDFIQQQIDIIKLLIDKDIAYQTRQAIYFDVGKLSDYGMLTGQKLSDKEIAARADVVTDKQKRTPQDFALWFFTVGRFAGHSMRWPSPWGEGFPGWHLECSAIIHATLGEPIDIHTGGVDHIGTHHTNEIAQTEAAFGVRLSNYWMHNEHLLVEGQKMSKSAGNFITLNDIAKKEIEPLALRLMFLQSHYRSQMDFNWNSLKAAAKNLKDLKAFADLRFQSDTNSSRYKPDFFNDHKSSILSKLQNDLATPAALAEIEQLSGKVAAQGLNKADLQEFVGFVGFLDDVLGLSLLDSSDIDKTQEDLIGKREESRLASDWHKADAYRQELHNNGIEINDTARGPIWRRL